MAREAAARSLVTPCLPRGDPVGETARPLAPSRPRRPPPVPLSHGTAVMSQLKPRARTRPPRAKKAALDVVHPHAAAIDVHSDLHVVCVGPDQVRSFGAYTVDLHAIAAHLAAHKVTTVVLESTGVYWVPLFELL